MPLTFRLHQFWGKHFFTTDYLGHTLALYEWSWIKHSSPTGSNILAYLKVKSFSSLISVLPGLSQSLMKQVLIATLWMAEATAQRNKCPHMEWGPLLSSVASLAFLFVRACFIASSSQPKTIQKYTSTWCSGTCLQAQLQGWCRSFSCLRQAGAIQWDLVILFIVIK